MSSVAVSIRQLRNETPRVIELIESGVEVTLTNNGTPIAEIRPVGAGRMNPGQRFVDRIAVIRGEAYDSGLADVLAAEKSAALGAQKSDRWG